MWSRGGWVWQWNPLVKSSRDIIWMYINKCMYNTCENNHPVSALAGICASLCICGLCRIWKSISSKANSTRIWAFIVIRCLWMNQKGARTKFKWPHSWTMGDASLTGGTVKCRYHSLNQRGYPEPFSQQEDKHCKPSRRTAWSKTDDCVCMCVCVHVGNVCVS